ncbi:LacI family DNA-binding transcriptional regulator [Pseudovibrio sp. Tun.PSC04-5.I4]|uniref:LacI family DNA-binding transcriptional regulator n=1 Tax=Pseudovibrio sp. Tun.PSC04-5.I4 TaxID=1798213 RepID=UPI00087E02C5|nr:LacI family DNA-binding transcriptional regulator [Pseudovibrio sp. Tun.PSC04-5.I4]SDR48430.1 transcriptional regulator, LacI family [Pseudovibrio sp. Tun.PSC04-5.I4]
MATVKDVAKLAGVSASTVSATLNATVPVKEETRKKVLAAVKQIGYRPNSAARSLRSGSSKLIGMIVPDIANPHFARAAKLVERACIEAGFMVMVYSSDEDTQIEMKVIQMMSMQRVAGLIHIPTLSSSDYGSWFEAQVEFPVVLLDSYIEKLPYNSILSDHNNAGQLATEYLLSLGHRNLAIFVSTRDVSSIRNRVEGCLSALAKHGLCLDPTMLIDAEFDQDVAFAKIQQVMSSENPPTAVLSLNNMMTIGILRGLRNMGLNYPKDVSVVGIDNFELSDYIYPPITVVSQPIEEMAVAAISTLLSEIRGELSPRGHSQVFAPTMLVRQSCRAI